MRGESAINPDLFIGRNQERGKLELLVSQLKTLHVRIRAFDFPIELERALANYLDGPP